MREETVDGFIDKLKQAGLFLRRTSTPCGIGNMAVINTGSNACKFVRVLAEALDVPIVVEQSDSISIESDYVRVRELYTLFGRENKEVNRIIESGRFM